MKLERVGVISAAILAVTTVAWAQKPDFSGTVETTNARGTQKRVYKK